MSEIDRNFTPTFVGHEDAVRQVTEALKSGRMHHAWLIAGMEGIGKATLAQHIAISVLSGGENEIGNINVQHRVTKLVIAEAHPDMLVVSRGVDEKTGEPRKVIIVDDVLKISSFLHKTSTHGGWRVVILDEAHTLNRFGQNALLKILEEPPSRTLLLITVTTPGALLPTIRSRCRVLHLAPLGRQQMKAVLMRHTPDLSEEGFSHLLEVSGGSVGFALKVLETEMMPFFVEITKLVSSPRLDIARVHKIAEKISPKSEADSYEVMTTLLLDYLSKNVQYEVASGPNWTLLDRKVQLWDKIREIFAVADDANLDRKLAFVNAVSDVHAATL